jgi:DNA processing protein
MSASIPPATTARSSGAVDDGGATSGGTSPGDGRVSDAEAATIACLARLPGITTARLRALLAHPTAEALAVVRGESPPPSGLLADLLTPDRALAVSWSAAVRRHPPERCADELERSGTAVHRPGGPSFPPQLLGDPRCPAALFVRGDLAVLDARRVGVVGTRNCTRRGRDTAIRFGRGLADQGVVVVSGLALGIDGAAHRGALVAEAAPPVAVVGSGPDTVYPRRHAELWEQVAARGAIISEWPPGTPPDAFRFPLRNRLIAALSEVLVVVESRERGGSLITAREAAERGVDVFAVPGALESRASAGTNRLLRDGASPAIEIDDVLVALGLDHRRAGRSRVDPRPPPRGTEVLALDRCREAPATVDSVAQDLGLSVAEAALALARLERSGWLYESGGWFEVADAPTARA